MQIWWIELIRISPALITTMFVVILVIELVLFLAGVLRL